MKPIMIRNLQCINDKYFLVYFKRISSDLDKHGVAVSDNYWDDISDGYSIPDERATIGYFIPDEIPTTCFELGEIDVFTSNIMVLHHEISQTVKIKVNRYTNIYLLMILFKINQFILIYTCISALLSFICCILLQENKTWHKVLRTLY